MIKPIYFPFTYVPEWVAEALAVCFGRFTVYQPSGRKPPPEMQTWIDANVMEVRVPVQTEGAPAGAPKGESAPLPKLTLPKQGTQTPPAQSPAPAAPAQPQLPQSQ